MSRRAEQASPPRQHFDIRGASVCADLSACVSCFPLKEIPAADMGRQEGDYAWKKNTENIQEIFEFIEELGS